MKRDSGTDETPGAHTAKGGKARTYGIVATVIAVIAATAAVLINRKPDPVAQFNAIAARLANSYSEIGSFADRKLTEKDVGHAADAVLDLSELCWLSEQLPLPAKQREQLRMALDVQHDIAIGLLELTVTTVENGGGPLSMAEIIKVPIKHMPKQPEFWQINSEELMLRMKEIGIKDPERLLLGK